MELDEVKSSSGVSLVEYIQAWLVPATQDLNALLLPRQRVALAGQLDRTKVEVKCSGSRQQHTILGVSHLGAERQTVLFPGEDARGLGLLTIAQYCHQVLGITLHYPALNCIQLERNLFMPMEVVKILSPPKMKSANLCDALAPHSTAPAPHSTAPALHGTAPALLNTAPAPLLTPQAPLSTAPAPPSNAVDKPDSNTERHYFFSISLPAQAPEVLEAKPKPSVILENKLYSPASLHTWALYVFARGICSRDMALFLIELKARGQCLGMDIDGPVLLRFHKACYNPYSHWQTLTHTYPGLQMIMVVMEDEALHGRVTVVGDLCLGVVTQCVPPSTVKYLCPATLDTLVLHINTKLGGMERRPGRIANPPFVAPSVMILALHHNAALTEGGQAVVAVVASVSRSPAQYVTEVQMQTTADPSIHDLAGIVRRLLRTFTGRYDRPVPEQIIVFCDGVSREQEQRVMEKERKVIMEACKQFMTNYTPGITFIAVHAMASPNGMNHPEQLLHPRAVSRVWVTQISQQEFRTYTRSGGRGSEHPCHYSVLWDSNKIPTEEVGRLTHTLCSHHTPPPLPCHVIYARRAAHRCRVHVKTLCDSVRLKYEGMQEDMSRLVRMDTSRLIAHKLYYV